MLEKLINHKLTYIASVVVLFVMMALNLVGTNTLATQGFVVSEIESQTIALENENRDLQIRVEEKTNLREISERASENGFIKARDIVFMPTPPTTALR